MDLLVTVAHPDDEAFGCGSVLAHASAAGWSSTVVCGTRGELGEIAPDAAAEGVSAETLGAVREAELREACRILGVGRVDVLDWIDSGMEGDPAAGSLVAAADADVADAIRAVIEEIRPDVVVTLDASDGHRDHAKIRDATLAAIDAASHQPAATYLWCLPRSLMSSFTGVAHLGTPEEDITTVVDVEALMEQRWAAMHAHRSQAPPYASMDPQLQHAFLSRDHLRRVHPAPVVGVVDDDWVAGYPTDPASDR
jgi:LmbE family N-acetylglucosaminyl deacetylase